MSPAGGVGPVPEAPGVITDYSQVALLLHSVGEWVSKPYLDAFIGAAFRSTVRQPVRAGPRRSPLPGRAGGGDDDPPGQGAGVAGGHCGIGRF